MLPPSLPGADEAPSAQPGITQRIAFYSDNGHGLGHITRLMAIARRIPADAVPIFFTMSESHNLVRQLGFPVEFVPSPTKLGLNRIDWDELFHVRLERFIETFRPSVIVIDHVNPPQIFRRIAVDHPDVALVWSRRGLWSDGRNRRALLLHDVMDLVVEPMDIASPFDRGDTIQFRDVERVHPITFLDRSELVDRQQARRELGLPADGTAILLQLSADSPTALRSVMTQARDLLHAVDPQIAIYAPLHVLHQHTLGSIDGVRMTPVYPVSRYLNAFDGAISTAGYNSFHELVMAAVPTVFVERNTNSLDDQGLRARVIARAGASLYLPTLSHDEPTRTAIAALLDAEERERLRAALHVLYPGNGATQAAEAISRSHLAGASNASASEYIEVPSADLDERHRRRGLARRRFTSGPALAEELREAGTRVLVVAYDLDDAGLVGLATDLRAAQRDRPDLKPVVLVHGAATQPLSHDRWQYETVVTREHWFRLDLDLDHDTYLTRRIEQTHRLYDTSATLTISPERPLRSEELPPPAEASEGCVDQPPARTSI